MHILVVGEFNCKIGNSIKSNGNTIAKASKMLIEQINRDNLHVIDAGEIVMYLENGAMK